MPLKEYAEYFVRGGRKDETGRQGYPREGQLMVVLLIRMKLLTEQGGINPQAYM